MLLMLASASLLCGLDARGQPERICLKKDDSAAVTREGPVYRRWDSVNVRFLSGDTIRIDEHGVIRRCNFAGQNCR